MPNPTPSRLQQPYSRKHARSAGFTDPRQIVLLADNLTRDYYTYKDEFDTVTVANNDYWSVSNTGAGAADPVKSLALGQPSCIFTTGGGNPGVSTLYGTDAAVPSGDNPFIYCRFRWPANVTAFYFNIGLVNVDTTKTTVVISGLTAAAVPTAANDFTDGVVFSMNTGFTLTTPALSGVGTSTAIAGVKVVNSAGTAYTPSAGAWVDLYLRASVAGGYLEIYEDDVQIARHTVASGPDTAKGLFPFILFGDLGTSKVVHLTTYKMVRERNYTP